MSSIPRKKCINCGGKAWFPSAIGLVSCQMCGGDGLGAVDIKALVQQRDDALAKVDSIKTVMRGLKELMPLEDGQMNCYVSHTFVPDMDKALAATAEVSP